MECRQYPKYRDDGGGGGASEQKIDSGSITSTIDVTKKHSPHDNFTDLQAAVTEIENRDSFENLAKALANALESDTLNPSMGDLLAMKTR